MWRDPMDELIDDLEQALPPERERFSERPSHAEFCYWTDRMLYSRPLTKADLDGTAKPEKLDFEDDPPQTHPHQQNRANLKRSEFPGPILSVALRRAARATAGGEGAVVTSPDVQSPAPDLLQQLGCEVGLDTLPTPTSSGVSL